MKKFRLYAKYLLLIPVIIFFALSWQKSLTGDEGLTVYLAGNSYSELINTVSEDFHVPGYYTYLWLYSGIFGNSLLALRLSSLIIVLLLIYITVRYLSFPAAILIALSPFTFHLALEIRMYGMLALAGLMFVLSMRKYLKEGNKLSLCLLILVISFASWIHYFGWIACLAALIILLVRKKWKSFIVVGLAVSILFLPWVGNVIEKINTDSEIVETQDMGISRSSSVVDRISGVPFSLAGTLLRFSGGTAVFNFSEHGIRSMGYMFPIGVVVALIILVFAIRGFGKEDIVNKVLLLLTLVLLSLIRPTARHFSIAFVSYMMISSAGLPDHFLWKRRILTVTGVFMLILCIPMVRRTTIPQRCSFDRDFLEAAELCSSGTRGSRIPVVLYLDMYSFLGMNMHLQQLEFPDSLLWHPHRSSLETERCFVSNPVDALFYLQTDTDSLVAEWFSFTDVQSPYILVANNPEKVRGRIFGERGHEIIGSGSDVMSDLDLMNVLRRKAYITEWSLSNSEGPFSIFLIEPL